MKYCPCYRVCHCEAFPWPHAALVSSKCLAESVTRVSKPTKWTSSAFGLWIAPGPWRGDNIKNHYNNRRGG